MFEDFEQKLESAELKYLRSSGKQFLTQIKKVEIKFKNIFDDSKEPIVKPLLPKLHNFMNIYQIITYELCDTCCAVQANSFGQCIVRMFEQILRIFKYLLYSAQFPDEKENNENDTKLKFTQLQTNTNPSKDKQENQYKLKTYLKEIGHRKVSLNEQITDPDAILKNLKESKEKVMSVKGSEAKFILDQAIRTFKTKGEYLQKFVALRENYPDMMQYQNVSAEEVRLENDLKHKNKEALGKLKNIFTNFLANWEKNKNNEKNLMQKERSLSKKINRSKKRIDTKKSENIWEQKIKQLKGQIQRQSIQKITLESEIQELKKYYNNKIIQLQNKIPKNPTNEAEKSVTVEAVSKNHTSIQCILIGEQDMRHRKKTRFIKNKTNRLKFQKKVYDLCLIRPIVSQNMNDQLGMKIDSASQLRNSLRLRPRKESKLEQNKKFHENLEDQIFDQVLPEKATCPTSTGRSTPHTQRQNHRNMKFKKSTKKNQKKIVSSFKKPQIMIHQQRKESQVCNQARQFYRIKQISATTFDLNEQTLSNLFLTVENGCNYQHLYVSEMILKKHHHNTFILKKEKQVQRGVEKSEIGLNEIVKSVWELFQKKRIKNKQHYWKLCIFFRYPYSSIFHQFNPAWMQSLPSEPSLNYHQLTNTLTKAYGFHSSCDPKIKNSNIEHICSHWSHFLLKLGIIFVPL